MSKIDKITVLEKKIKDLLYKKDGAKYIREKLGIYALKNQDPNENVPLFGYILKNIEHRVLKTPNRPWEIIYHYKGSSGTTKVSLLKKYDPDKPTIIFHHGMGVHERVQVAAIFTPNMQEKFNIFSVSSPHQTTTLTIVNKFFDSFNSLAGAVASSVLAVDEVVKFHRKESKKNITVMGLSLGGIVTSLHYFHIGKADFYFPIISYPNFGKILLNNRVEKLIPRYKEIVKNKRFFEIFDIPPKLKVNRGNIFPILGKHDETIDYHEAKAFWLGYPVTVFNSAHFSTATKIPEIRKILIDKMQE